MTKTQRPSVKRTPVESSAEDAVSYAYETIGELRDEIGEVVDTMSDSPGLSATSRYSTLEETKSTLDDPADSAPDWPDHLSEVRCSYTENRERKLTRAGRRDNASSALDAAASAIREWAEERENDLDALREAWETLNDDEAEHDEQELADLKTRVEELATRIGGEGASAEELLENGDSEMTEARELADTLEGHRDAIDGAEFPGMRG